MPNVAVQVEPREQRFDRKILAILRANSLSAALIGLVVALSIVAFALYKDGQPGMPTVPEGFESKESWSSNYQPAVRVFASPDLPLMQRATFKPDGSFRLDISQVEASKKESYVIVQFSGSQWPKNYGDYGVLLGTQVGHSAGPDNVFNFLVRIDNRIRPVPLSPLTPVFHVEGKLSSEIVSRENSRILVSLPKINAPVSCNIDKSVNISTLGVNPVMESLQLDCPADLKKSEKQGQRVDLDGIFPQGYKIDYSSVLPEQEPYFSWFSQNGLKVSVSMTDMKSESEGQRNLFVAGVLGGLAGGLLPTIIERLGVRKRREGSRIKLRRAG
ncbi:hypothetical protein [Amycolatopsis coloradensis]|uniref:hypothetical protein n=1 Tax=Amycolatopsis coloradensis TaxID=76021 RepID=UPI0011780264|nr:hypothetical protein [Amycolatopsis coloradensis]